MNRPALISVFSDQRRTKSTTRSRTSCGTHTLVRAPQDFFLRPCAQPSIRPAPHPSSGSSFPGTRSVVVRLGGPDGSWTGRQPPRSRRTLFANGRTPLAAAPVPHTDRKPALYPANAVLGCQPSLRQCSASALFACVLSVILTEERSLQFQLRQDTGYAPEFGSRRPVCRLATSRPEPCLQFESCWPLAHLQVISLRTLDDCRNVARLTNKSAAERLCFLVDPQNVLLSPVGSVGCQRAQKDDRAMILNLNVRSLHQFPPLRSGRPGSLRRRCGRLNSPD